MKSLYKLFISAVCFALFVTSALQAQNHYVRAGATGANNGSDWTNAWTSLPSTLQRGHTYYIADGSYPSYTFDDAESGTTRIIVKKATVADHGTNTGWSNDFGDGQAEFVGRLVFTTGNYTIDGQTRNESDWFNGAAYGIKIQHNIANINQVQQQQIIMGNNGGPATNNITIQYVYIDAPYNSLPSVTVRQYAIDTDTYGGPQNTGLVFSHMYVYGSNNVWFIRATTGTIIEYSASDGVVSNGANHGEIVNVYFSVYNSIIRFNKFRNAYISGNRSNGGTALIAVAVNRNATVMPQIDCYGNVFSEFQCGDAAIGFLGNPTNGGNGTNCRIYNNTFVNGSIGGSSGIQFPDGSNNLIRNNLWINCQDPTIVGGANSTVTHNAFSNSSGYGSNTQTNVPASILNADFTLQSATTAGTTLSSPYNSDLLGNTRGADGTWDRGAYEFNSGVPSLPVITSALTKSGTVGVPFSYTITATNSPTSYSATPLPAGLTINTATGVISGTPTAAATTNVTVGATNAIGTGTATLVVTISAASTAYTVFTTQTPATSDTDGPYEMGMKFQSSQAGQITKIRYYKYTGESGTHTGRLWSSGGTQLASVTFSGETASGWQEATLSTPYTIAANTTYVVSVNSVVRYGATNNGLQNAVTNGPLSTIVGSNGVYGSPGTFPTSSFQNSNYFRDVVFTAPAAPIITSALTKTGTVGSAFSYTITATNSPTSYSATPLPAGLSINTTTGVISGTPTAAATTNVTIGATNASGTGTATLVVTIAVPAPVITSALTKSGTVGSAFSYTITATNSPTSYSATPLPAGLTINTATGVISGTPTAAGTTNVTIGATNANGTGTATLVITIGETASIWAPGDVPGSPSNPDGAVEVGVKFKSDISGVIKGIRFYKGTGNTGTHVGNLWTSGGNKLATVTFTGETGSGWQQANFSTPVSISANTTYVASYHAPNGGYAFDLNGLANGKDNSPLHAIANSVSANGVYLYGSGGFPTNSYSATNYWVDVVFQASAPPVITSALTKSGTVGVSFSYTITATNSPASYSATPLPAGLSINSTTGVISGTPTTAATTNVTIGATNADGTGTATLVVTISVAPPVITSALTSSGAYGVPFSYTITATNNPTSFSATNLPAGLSINTSTGVISGTPTANAAGTTNVTIGATNAGGTGTATLAITIATTIWAPANAPVNPSNPDGAVEVGVKFKSDVAGTITGIRFYKGTGNTGTHVGNLWTSGGSNLATVTFTGETGSGWQQANFSTPVSISANTTYVASYHAPNGGYAFDVNGLANGKDNSPLHAIANSVSANGVYLYGSGGFPTNSYSATNYWVDVVFISSGLKSASVFQDGQSSIETQESGTLVVYPNPANSILHIKTDLKLDNDSEIRIYNAIGNAVFIRKTGSTLETIDLSNFKNGVYLLRLQAEKGTSAVQRFIVQH